MTEQSDRIRQMHVAIDRHQTLIGGASAGRVVLAWEADAVIVAEVRLAAPWTLPADAGVIGDDRQR